MQEKYFLGGHMPVLDESVLKEVDAQIERELFPLLLDHNFIEIEKVLDDMILKLHASIAEKKRTSYGITYVVKTFAKHLFEKLENSNYDTFEMSYLIYDKMSTFRTKCIGLGVISHYGINDREKAFLIFRHAASHELWEIRDFAQMYIRKITKKHPLEVQKFLIELSKSDDPNLRRFSSESLRPVVENRWIIENPEFSLTVLRNLFREDCVYPRVSVANNLSDLSRNLPELIFSVVEELISFNDKNSDFVAHRACRNLIEKDPIRVMDLLKVDEYKYKKRNYKRSDYS